MDFKCSFCYRKSIRRISFEDYSVWLFFIVGITSFISAIFTYILIKENRLSQTSKIVQTIEENKTNIKKEKFNLLSIFTFQLFLFLCIGQLLLNILKEQFPNYLSIRIVSKYPLENINISRYKIIGYLNLEDTIIVTLAAGLIIKLTKKLSEKTTLIMGLLLFILGYIFLSYFIHPVLLMLGMLFISVGGLIYLPTLQAITAKSIPEQTRGTHLSILGLIGALGGMLSSLFIWGMKYIPEIGVTYIFICIGIFIIYIYINVYKYAHNGNIEKHTDNKTYNYSKGN